MANDVEQSGARGQIEPADMQAARSLITALIQSGMPPEVATTLLTEGARFDKLQEDFPGLSELLFQFTALLKNVEVEDLDPS